MWQWDDMVYCSGCGVEVTWSPRYRNGRAYCCEDCAHGQVCECDHSILNETEAPMDRDVAATELLRVARAARITL